MQVSLAGGVCEDQTDSKIAFGKGYFDKQVVQHTVWKGVVDGGKSCFFIFSS